jgi:superfamily II DNA or RNA helicase
LQPIRYYSRGVLPETFQVSGMAPAPLRQAAERLLVHGSASVDRKVTDLEPLQPRSAPQRALFSIDDEVRLISQPDRAGRVTAAGVLIQGEYWYSIYFGPGQRGRHPESDLERYNQTFDIHQLFVDSRFAGHEAFVKRITYLKLAQSLRSHIYALQASKTHFYPYQFKPVLKFLDSWRHRLLIADEVGLGKTIEAGLILTELRARLDLARVLIVAPSHLLTKWQMEMRTRFGLDFDILDRARTMAHLAAVERDGDEVRARSIISLQTLRGRALQERWESVAPTFDIVIVDEAGRLRNPSTQSHHAASLVAENSDAVLMLTATPVQTREYDLFSLLNLLDPDDFADFTVYGQRLQANQFILEAMRLIRSGRVEDLAEASERLDLLTRTAFGSQLAKNQLFADIRRRLGNGRAESRRDLVELQRDLNTLNLFGHIMSRTRRAEVEESRPLRSAQTVTCVPAPIEADFYHRVTELCRAAYKKAQGNAVAAFSVMMPQRQMASCMPAMVDYLRDRLNRGDWTIADPEQSDLHAEDFDTDGEEEQPAVNNRPAWDSLGDLTALRSQLEACDTKWSKLRDVLFSLEREQPGEKIVVFSFFKRTLAYLRDRMAREGITTELISGDVPSVPSDPDQDERAKRLEKFKRDKAVRVLLSTEVGNEGLDMQFCHVLVNYDLPWNPMTVEQRIGRLDRIGQRANRIHIYNLTIPGTIEDLILERLYKRVKIFEQSIGDLEDLLGEIVRELTQDLFSPDLSTAEQEARIIQAADTVERKRLEQEALDSRLGSLIGHDEFFADEISRVRESRRYVTADELLVIIRDFLAAYHPQCALTQQAASVWTIEVSEQLRWFVKSMLGSEDPGWFEFQRRTGRSVLELTTDGDAAQDRQNLDLLTFYHPLVRAVAKHYEQNTTELHPVSLLRVGSTAVPPGTYAWAVFLTEVTGARPVKDLDFILVESATSHVVDLEAGDTLFWDMTARGESIPPGEQLKVAIHGELITKAEAIGIERLNGRFADRNRLNSATVDARLASLDAAHERNIAVRAERLRVAEGRDRAPQYLRMLEGGIRKLNSSYQMKRRELEAQRTLGRSISLQAAGLVEVRNG